jgi:hypothetical protein
VAFDAYARRAIPYVLIAVAGFALAFVVTYYFVLPDAPPQKVVTTTTDSTQRLLPVTEAPSLDEIMPDIEGPALPPDEPPEPIVAVTVPDLIGKDMWDAQETLHRLRLVVIIRHDTSSFEIPNTVVRQTPSAGQRLFPNDTVIVTISQFPPIR